MKICPICIQEMGVAGFPFRHYQVYICQNCGFRWLDPQPTDLELSEIYSDHYFLDEGDTKVMEIVKALKRATAILYLQQLAQGVSTFPHTQSSLLEIGCGMGDFLLEAQSRGFIVSGLEVTDHLVEMANRRLGSSRVQKGYLESSGFEKASFDVVAFFDVLEHVRSPVDFMMHVSHLLRETGKVYIVTPSLDSWSAKFLGKNWMEYKVEHLSYFNKKAITILLEKTGFQKIRFHSNYKILNLDYINRHFVRFPVKGISPLVNFARKVIPDKLAYLPVKVIASGMAVIAEKRELVFPKGNK
jgi:2-polyprenyl-3-methyl-5-hydroxy-6-metoxy-1,4-benzoquinol methylase